MFVDAISIGTTSPLPFSRTLDACRAALADQGFGVLHEFDFQAAVLDKTGTDIGPYRVLAACHPASAAQALSAVPSIGVLLPCNLAVFERDDAVYVRSVNPKPQMRLLDRDEIDEVAEDITDRLHRVLDAIAAAE
jgi:uncharacterized protein (DUF302 family)